MEPPKTVVVIDEWKGINLAVAPYAVPFGNALDQVNVLCINDGELRSRGGLRQFSFEWSASET